MNIKDFVWLCRLSTQKCINTCTINEWKWINAISFICLSLSCLLKCPRNTQKTICGAHTYITISPSRIEIYISPTMLFILSYSIRGYENWQYKKWAVYSTQRALFYCVRRVPNFILWQSILIEWLDIGQENSERVKTICPNVHAHTCTFKFAIGVRRLQYHRSI